MVFVSIQGAKKWYQFLEPQPNGSLVGCDSFSRRRGPGAGAGDLEAGLHRAAAAEGADGGAVILALSGHAWPVFFFC